MCKTVLYSFTVILGSARNIEMLNDACMLFPVAISKKCRKSLRYSIGFSCFSDAPVAVVLSRSVARSKSVIGRRSSWISRMHPLHTLFPFQMLVSGVRFAVQYWWSGQVIFAPLLRMTFIQHVLFPQNTAKTFYFNMVQNTSGVAWNGAIRTVLSVELICLFSSSPRIDEVAESPHLVECSPFLWNISHNLSVSF